MDKTPAIPRETLNRRRLPALAAPAPEPLYSVHNVGVGDPRQVERMRHSCHHLTLSLSGGGRFRTGPVELPARRPLLFFRPAGDEAIIASAGPYTAWYAGFHWQGLVVRRVGQELGLAWGGRSLRLPRVKPLSNAQAPRLVELYSGLRSTLQRQGLGEELRARALMMELLASWIELPPGLDASMASRTVARFHELLTARACGNDSIEDLARMAGASANHLRTLFRDHYGARPVEYRTNLRLARARELLATTAMNVKSVAREVGFDDPLYFSRAFRARFGISPREMIRSFRLAR